MHQYEGATHFRNTCSYVIWQYAGNPMIAQYYACHRFLKFHNQVYDVNVCVNRWIK